MPTAKPRLQGEVYSLKSYDPGREEGDSITGLSGLCFLKQDSWTNNNVLVTCVHWLFCYTVELRFLEPPRETKIGSRNRELRNIGGKITVKTSPRETTFGQSRNRGF